MGMERRESGTTASVADPLRGALRILAAAAGGVLALGGWREAGARPADGDGGGGRKSPAGDQASEKDDKPKDGNRADGDRDRNPGKDDAVRREAGEQPADPGETREERRAERDARRDEADQTAGDDTTEAGDGLADRLRDRAESFRARQGADEPEDDASDGDDNGPVGITVDLEREAEDAVDVDLNIPDLSNLLADLPDVAAGSDDDDITFAQAGDSIALSGSAGTFAIANPDDDAGGDNDVDFAS